MLERAAYVVFGYTLLYNVPLIVTGIVVVRRSGSSLRSRTRLSAGAVTALPAGWIVFAMVPCLNEEKVIGPTVRNLLDDQPGVRVVVIDDGSDDATAQTAVMAGEGRVTLVRRSLPAARQGKGAALNAGLSVVRRQVGVEGLDPGRVLVCVMDADGRMSPGAAARVVSLFDDREVGGAQLVVSIRGRSHWALRIQDFEFWGLSALTQLGRIATCTVSMAGNAQFARLSALDSVGPEPWSASLTEDLDLGISLAARGWKVVSCTGAFVSQQGLTDPRRLLRQRTRWAQGHMSAITRLPELWKPGAIGFAGRLELTGYLLVPYLITLPYSVIQQLLLLRLLEGPGPVPGSPWLSALTCYVMTFAAHLAWAVVYWRRAEDLPLWRAIVCAHLLMPWLYVSFIACWRAIYRIATGRHGWSKTDRADERTADGHA
ncbi:MULTISPECIES: glycosyltransferase [Streptomyces]|uniref:glycosyltransferase family 2 protein n=1 Tax=Streptomyces TaxID=1883 RepID=UPI0031D9EE29